MPPNARKHFEIDGTQRVKNDKAKDHQCRMKGECPIAISVRSHIVRSSSGIANLRWDASRSSRAYQVHFEQAILDVSTERSPASVVLDGTSGPEGIDHGLAGGLDVE